MKIDSFDGKYAFLSNFYDATVEMDGLTYLNAEAAFQAAKCEHIYEREAFTTLPPNKAKKLGRQVPLRPDWHQIRLKVMENVVRNKFRRHPELREKLINTGNAELIEGNWWHDTFWGVDAKTGEGENHLGQILMKIRAELSQPNVTVYNKLVRDKIPEILLQKGIQYTTEFLSDEEYIEKLNEKLDEELNEYKNSRNIEELADLLEVIYALAEATGYTNAQLNAIRTTKAHNRGKFTQKILLKTTIE